MARPALWDERHDAAVTVHRAGGGGPASPSCPEGRRALLAEVVD